jgi:tetratricopeptide (TPR) repeat protein
MAHPKSATLKFRIARLAVSLAVLARAISVHAASGHEPIMQAGKEDQTVLATDAAAEELRRQAGQAFQERRYADAERVLRLALEKFETNRDAFLDKITATLGELSSVLTSQERYSEAEQILQRSIEIMKTQELSRHGRISIVMGNLGSLYQLTGRFKDAERTLNEALRSAQKYLGPEAPYVAVLHSNLAAVYARAGKDKRAEESVRKALAIGEKNFGKDSVELQPALVNLAAIYERDKKWAAAETTLIRTLAIVENSKGTDDPDASLILEHLAVVHFKQKKLEKAEAELRRAIDIERTLNQTRAIRTASLSFNLARVLSARAKYDEARTLFGEALEGHERSFGVSSPIVATTLEEYAKVLHSVKSDALARQMEFRAKQIRAERAYTVPADQER